MSGEKRAVDEASWEFTVELLGGILIRTAIVQGPGPGVWAVLGGGGDTVAAVVLL